MKENMELLKGFQDFLPEDKIGLQKIIDTCRGVYENYGFRPQETPAMEYLELLSSEEGDTGKQIYHFIDKEENAIGLRFDLTVPLSRIIATHARDLRFPYKRCQYGRVWRYDKPRPGRYREFGQFDVDIVGSLSYLADGEICAIMHDVVEALGFGNFLVRINSRKILTGLANMVGLKTDDQAKQLFRELDKMDKQGWNQVKKTLLTGIHEEKKTETGLKLPKKAVEQIETFLALSSELQLERAEEGSIEIPKFHSNEEILEKMKKFFAKEEAGLKGREELEGILHFLTQSGIEGNRFQIDTNIARGLDYYTGPVYETTLIDHPSFGSVYSGGRYDHMLGRYIDYKVFFKEFQEYRQKWKDPLNGEPILPATGASLGVDRIFAITKELGMFDGKKTPTEVLVVTMDTHLFGECQKMAQILRKSGISAELYTGDSRSIKHQLRYADRLDIPLALIYGENEHKEGLVAIKDLRKGREDETKQKPIPKGEMVELVKGLLKS